MLKIQIVKTKVLKNNKIDIKSQNNENFSLKRHKEF